MHRRAVITVIVVILVVASVGAFVYVREARAAASAVAEFFTRCAAETVASPSGCPQSSADTGTDFRWTLVGDPSASLALTVDGSGKVLATGHYLMIDTFSATFPNGLRHRIQGGPFEAVLDWNGGAMKVERVSQVKAPPLEAPNGVTDGAIKSNVAAAFMACTAAPPDGSGDCPQFDFAPDAANFRWNVNGDPLADTTVTFEGARGVWQVMGNYSFHDSFDLPTGHQEHDVNGTYFAYVVYDGSKLMTVYIRHI